MLSHLKPSLNSAFSQFKPTSYYISISKRHYFQSPASMKLQNLHGLNCAVLPPKQEHKHTVVWSHGLGDSHEGFQGLFEMVLQSPHMKVILPNAPKRPITVNGGMTMPGWYDIVSLGMDRKYNPEEEDVDGILKSAQKIAAIVNDEIAELGDSQKVIIGGFSQGAALSLLTCFSQLDQKLAALICCSGYWCLRDKQQVSLKHKNDTPMLVWHGKYDPVVPFDFAMDGYEQFKKAYGDGLSMETHVGNFEHSMDMEQAQQIKKWMKERLA
mmetsp:Transcript_10692/g.39977  ORF Transcript_10692/g.39977 Transcript_10692/m.39977 type:complete len:269 (+) Transcript_10692:47-853(+)